MLENNPDMVTGYDMMEIWNISEAELAQLKEKHQIPTYYTDGTPVDASEEYYYREDDIVKYFKSLSLSELEDLGLSKEWQDNL